MLRIEVEAVEQLMQLGLTAEQSVNVLESGQTSLNHKRSGENQVSGYYDIRESGGATVWWNDLEKDSRYKSWPYSLSAVC